MKKGLVALLVFAMVCILSTAFAVSFPDVSRDMWAYEPIERWAGERVIVGYDDGTYKPNNLITRAEFCEIVVKIFGPTKEADLSKYTDVSKNDWFYSSLAKAVQMGAIEPASTTRMKPNDYVTRQEAVVILNAVLKFAPARKSAVKEFEDYEEIADYAENDVEVFAERDYVIGYPDGTFRPAETITRAEAAQILQRIISLIITSKGGYDLTGIGVNQFVVIKATDVTVKNSDQANIIFLNDTVKESTKGMTGAQKANCVVINKGTDSDSKSTGRTSSSGGSSSSDKVTVINIKNNGDQYAVTGNNVKLKNGGKLTVKVNGTAVFTRYTVNSNTIMTKLFAILDAMDMNRVINTLDNATYGEDEDVQRLGRAVISEMVIRGYLTVDDKAALDDNAQGGLIKTVYNNMTADSRAQAKSIGKELLEEGYATGEFSYEDIIAKLNEF